MPEVCVAKRNGKISAIGRQRVNIYSESGTKRRKHLPLFSFSRSRILYKLFVPSQKFSFGRFQKKKKKKNRPATSRIIHDNAVAFSVVVVFRIPCSCRFSEKGRGCERAKNRSGKESTGVKTRGLFSASCF